MNKLLATTAVLAALIAPVNASSTLGQVNNQTNGVRWCLSSDTENKAWCLGYVLGAAHVMGVWEHMSKDTAKICIPEKTNADELRAVLLDFYKRGNAEVKAYNIDDVALFAFEEKWPCSTEPDVVPATPINPRAKEQDLRSR